MSDKAQRAEIPLGSVTIEGFMLPDGSYVMSQTQAAHLIGENEINARRFLESKAIKALLGDGYTPDTFEIERDPEQGRGQGRIRGLPLEIVSTFWLQQTFRGNQQARSLCMALMRETLERRFDAAFGVTRSEDERNQRLSERNAELERALRYLGEGMAMEDELLRRLEQYERWFQETGYSPYELPTEEGGENN
ncbi:hypothetical protein [Leptolyngbya sp. FACHB-8]|uniref:hypothetical protein n=1 Tax=unclassified Leptolyngbya TaxID=2650499 RepID=UPI00168A0801|nr:hypothetical protein [Leptolyngbya sp. FACHB-8]MBD1911290.1 hypothetical protein [Leptolyngbya sp. FACHB-8]